MNMKRTVVACSLALMGTTSALYATEVKTSTTVSGETTVTETTTPTAWATTTRTTTEPASEFSANIGVTSNYLWRGVTQTDDGPAVSGGVDWSHNSGIYLGTWISNIDWGDGDGAEVDFYGGFAGEYEDFGYDLGLIYYYYPATGFEDSDFLELAVSGSWKWLSAGINYTLTGDADSAAPFSDGDIYYHIGASVDFADSWSAGVTVGHYDFDTSSAWEDLFGDGDYTHVQGDLTKSAGEWGDFTLTVSWAEEESGDDDTKFVVSWTKSF
ncbi:MAG: TorF family putative porin [Pseudomonadota bacterium]